MKTAISIPDPVFEAGEALARRLRITRSELYARAVAELVKEHSPADVKERLDRIYGNRPSGPDPVLARIQEASIRREDW